MRSFLLRLAPSPVVALPAHSLPDANGFHKTTSTLFNYLTGVCVLRSDDVSSAVGQQWPTVISMTFYLNMFQLVLRNNNNTKDFSCVVTLSLLLCCDSVTAGILLPCFPFEGRETPHLQCSWGLMWMSGEDMDNLRGSPSSPAVLNRDNNTCEWIIHQRHTHTYTHTDVLVTQILVSPLI